MQLKVTKRGGVNMVLFPQDLKLLVKALQCLSRHLEEPHHESEAYFADAMRASFAAMLLAAELEYRSTVGAFEESRQIVNQALMADAGC